MQRELVLVRSEHRGPHRRTALEGALATIELELQQLGWIIKL